MAITGAATDQLVGVGALILLLGGLLVAFSRQPRPNMGSNSFHHAAQNDLRSEQ